MNCFLFEKSYYFSITQHSRRRPLTPYKPYIALRPLQKPSSREGTALVRVIVRNAIDIGFLQPVNGKFLCFGISENHQMCCMTIQRGSKEVVRRER